MKGRPNLQNSSEIFLYGPKHTPTIQNSDVLFSVNE